MIQRNYCAQIFRSLSDVDELISFFGDEATYIDGPTGIQRGIEAIRGEFATQVQMVPSTTVDIKILVADGGPVMVERAEQFQVDGKPIEHEVVGVFEVDGDCRITRWRDYYDLTSLADRVVTATASATWAVTPDLAASSLRTASAETN